MKHFCILLVTFGDLFGLWHDVCNCVHENFKIKHRYAKRKHRGYN